MSCTAIAKCTWLIRSFSVFCGTLKVGPKSTASLTSGKSSAGSVCSVKRLLPACSVSLFCAADSVTTWSAGSVRRMSISLRAPTVVLKLPSSPPSSALVRTWISRSLVVISTCGPFLRISTLARIGSVCRRSTMPATDCRVSSTFSCGAFRTIMSSSFLELVVVVEDHRVWGQAIFAFSVRDLRAVEPCGPMGCVLHRFGGKSAASPAGPVDRWAVVQILCTGIPVGTLSLSGEGKCGCGSGLQASAIHTALSLKTGSFGPRLTL
jgi:hypothetical protein